MNVHTQFTGAFFERSLSVARVRRVSRRFLKKMLHNLAHDRHLPHLRGQKGPDTENERVKIQSRVESCKLRVSLNVRNVFPVYGTVQALRARVSEVRYVKREFRYGGSSGGVSVVEHVEDV